MNLLSICQGIADRIGITRPTAVIGASDETSRIILAALQQEGKDLSSRFNWRVLTKEKTFTSIAAETQTSAIPSDFDRFVDGTFWNRTENRIVLGPATAQEWQAIKANRIQAVHDVFRHRGTSLMLNPTPAAGLTYAYEYISTLWVADASDETVGTMTGFEADDDVPLLNAELVTLGAVWRYLRAKGLDYAEPFRSYEILLKRVQGRDGGSPTLKMTGPSDRYPAPRATIPDGNWNLS